MTRLSLGLGVASLAAICWWLARRQPRITATRPHWREPFSEPWGDL